MKFQMKRKHLIILAVLLILSLIGYFAITGMFVKTSEIKVVGEVDNFKITNQQVCEENGKPIIYFFGHSGCPHCQWQHPIISSVTAKFSNYISFHDNMDSNRDSDVYAKYSDINSGYVPFLVLGCKYVRVGSGENVGEASEIATLTKLMCNLTGNNPSDVCSA